MNEWDKKAAKSYQGYFDHKVDTRDIKDIEDIPDCDLMIGGFPCQGFSLARGYARSMEDQRNQLYLELVRLLKKKQPSYFLFENVKGILSMEGYETKEDKKNKTGRVMKMILSDFEKCGYNVKWKLFDLEKYNIPQMRKRVIFLGVRKDLDHDPQWPEPSTKILTLKDAIADLPTYEEPMLQHVTFKSVAKFSGFENKWHYDWDKPCRTLVCRPPAKDLPERNRRMTIREMARIQTFPDEFIFSGSKGAMARQIGNAVPPEFSRQLAEMF